MILIMEKISMLLGQKTDICIMIYINAGFTWFSDGNLLNFQT